MIKRGMTNDEKREYFRSAATASKQSRVVVALPVRAAPELIRETADSTKVAVTAAPTTTAQEQAQSKLNELADKANQPQSAQEKAAAAVSLIADKFDPFRDQQGTFYIRHESDAVNIVSTHATDIIRTTARELSGRSITGDNLEQVLTILRQTARALPARTVYQRIGKDGDAYLLDLGDQTRRCVRITAQAVTVIDSSATQAIFGRGMGYAQLPEPHMPSNAKEAWAFVLPLLQGLDAKDHLSFLAAKVEHMRCDSPHTILVFLGPPGSGKTSAARRAMQAIDPFPADPPSVIADEQAINAAAQTRHSLLIDNIGGALGGEIENVLCRSALGGATVVRELYTTADARTLALHVAWHLTGVTSFIRQADTLDRTLIMRVTSPPTGYQSEAKVRAKFDAQHPQILGGLLFFLGERMRYAAVAPQQPAPHRMVDFFVTGEAIAQALGAQPGKFTAARMNVRKTSARDWIEGDSFARALVAVVESMGHQAKPVATEPSWRTWGTRRCWAGQVGGRTTVFATAEEIRTRVTMHYAPGGPPPPSNARQTKGALERVQGELQQAGWVVVHKQVNGGSNSYWEFRAPV